MQNQTRTYLVTCVLLLIGASAVYADEVTPKKARTKKPPSTELQAKSLQAKKLPPKKPHPDAIANSHAPGEVDRPKLVRFIVKETKQLPGIVLDETDAVLKGSWQYSTHTPPYVGIGYLHDRKQGKGKSSVTYTPNLPAAGRYEVRISHCYNVRRSTNTPITIHSADGDKTIRINQQDVPKHKRLFRSLGAFQFEKGRSGYVRIGTKGTDGKYVIADAVQFIPLKTGKGETTRKTE